MVYLYQIAVGLGNGASQWWWCKQFDLICYCPWTCELYLYMSKFLPNYGTDSCSVCGCVNYHFLIYLNSRFSMYRRYYILVSICTNAQTVTPQLVGKARQLECPKIVLDHVCVYIYVYMFVHTTMLKYTLYWKYMNWRRTSNRNISSCKLMNIALRTKYQMLHVILIQDK